MSLNLRKLIREVMEGMESQIMEMKKTYPTSGKAQTANKWGKHLRPYGKKLANTSTRKINKDLSKDIDLDEAQIDEERISNTEAATKITNRENFVGSHTYGEDLGGLGQMYVAYSYGEQHPLYLWYKNKWYYNNQEYLLPDGDANVWTQKHLEDLKPNASVQARPNAFLKKLIKKFKIKHSIGGNSHSDLEPGEK
jgi:hypothetical protein